MADAVDILGKNLLLASLPAQARCRLVRRLEAVTFRADEHVNEVNQPVKYVHFPTKGCLISLVKVLADGKTFDAGPVGYDGVIGAEACFGAECTSRRRCGWTGEAVRMKISRPQGRVAGQQQVV